MIPVHLFGLCADMDSIGDVAREYGLWLVEDAACALRRVAAAAATPARSATPAASASTPRKSITTGEGGMLTTGDDDIDHGSRARCATTARRARTATVTTRPSAFVLADYEHLGYNYRLTDIQGALGCAQMDRADWILGRRGEIAARYDELLADLEWLTTPRVPAGDVHGYQAYVCLFAPEAPSLDNVEDLHRRRNQLMRRLEQAGVATRQGTHAPIALGYYRRKYDLRIEDYPNAYMADRLTLTLPLYPQMTDVEQDRVVDELRRCARDV